MPKEPIKSQDIKTGFVIVDGHDIPPPYTIEWTGEALQINGHAVKTPVPGRFTGPGFRQGFANMNSMEQQIVRLENQLREGWMLLIDADGNLESVDAVVAVEALEALTGDGTIDEKVDVLVALPFRQGGSWRWRTLVETFTPAPGLSERIEEGRRAFTFFGPPAPKRNRILRVLTTVGFVLLVLALGLLMMDRPTFKEGWTGQNPDPASLRQLYRCVGLLVLLNAYDLGTTLLTVGNAGVAEINPIFGKLLSNPSVVVFLKTGAVAFAAGVLLLGRRQRVAQAGSWWISLVYTVLLFRWVAVTSLLLT